MELLSCHWRILVNLDPHNAMLPIGNNFVFGSSAWIPLPRKWHWKGKVTRGWYSTWVKTQKFANCRFTEANFTSYFAILWFALGYAKICAFWVSLNWPLVINKSYVSTQRTIDQSNKTAILIQIWAFLVSIFLAKVSKYPNLNTFSIILGCQETVLLHKKASFPFIWRLLYKMAWKHSK